MANSYINFADAAGNPYSDMVIVDDRFLFLSGLISQDLESGEILKGDIAFEIKQILDNLETLLKRYGSGMDKVIRADVLLSDFAERDAMNAEYVLHFPEGHLPSRLCFGNVGLACDCRVELAVTAGKD